MPPMDTPLSIQPVEPVASDGGRPAIHGMRRLIPVLTIPVLLLVIWAAFQLTHDRDPTGKKTEETRALGAGIARAVHQFYEDYKRLPRVPGLVASEDQDTDTGTAAGLILILSGREPAGTDRQNTRNINYLAGMPAATWSAPGRWTGGVAVNGGDASLLDAWGQIFHIRLDANYTGEMDNPCPEESGTHGPTVPGRCLVWSAGKDGWGWTWRDNTKSWP